MNQILALVGPTASGKTEISLELAQKINAEIICMDSMLVYRSFDIGTAKPSLGVRFQIPHHVIDLIDAPDLFSAFDFCSKAQKAVEGIWARGKMPLLVGGTGFYLKAFEQGMAPVPEIPKNIRSELATQVETQEGRKALYREFKKVDPVLAGKVPIQNTYRLIRAMEVYRASGIAFSKFLEMPGRNPKKIQKIGLWVSKEKLKKNIAHRTSRMIEAGLVEEVQNLLKKYSPELKPMKSVGYKEAVLHLKGLLSLDEMKKSICFETWHLAKRQRTWFQKDPQIQWVCYEQKQPDKILAFC